jgi:hypothetical protein
VKKYTIEQQGDRWIASDGEQHVEGVSADEAFDFLLYGEINQEAGDGDFDKGVSLARQGDLSDRIGEDALALIRLLTLAAPPEIIRHQVTLLTRHVEEHLES